jgi:hypothetical protein
VCERLALPARRPLPSFLHVQLVRKAQFSNPR